MTKRKTPAATAPPDWYLDIWPELEALFGAEAQTMMAVLLEGEAKVSRWLSSQGRERASALTPDDLVPLLKATHAPPVSVRFGTALLLSRLSQVMAVSGVSWTGDVTVRSDRTISPKLPGIVNVRREKSPDRFAEVLNELGAAKVWMPPHLRAAAVARTLETGKPHPHSPEAGKQMKRRETRKAEQAGLAFSALKRGKPGRPKNSGRKTPPR